MTVLTVLLFGFALLFMYQQAQKKVAKLEQDEANKHVTMVGVGLSRKPYVNLTNNRLRGTMGNRYHSVGNVDDCEGFDAEPVEHFEPGAYDGALHWDQSYYQ